METTEVKKKKRLYNRINREELKQRLAQSTEARTTVSFYRYFQIEDPQSFRDQLFEDFYQLGVLGRVYLAKEGINAQISVLSSGFDAFKNYLYSIPALDNLRLNIAIEDDGKSFFVLKIKVRNKIVADGIDDPDFDSSNMGIHLKAAAFNEITEDPETVLVDMRNHYESEVGHFENAITPDVETFRESLPIIAEQLKDYKDKKIVMYCTGGIRCEKASAYMKYRGFRNVFQLEGGIIEYARQAKAQGLPNKFKGKNFVFDERLGERIGQEIISQCHQCGAPCDHHVNCANYRCHYLVIQCDACAEKYQGCCSQECTDFIQLPENEQIEKAKTIVFNGTRFGKGRRR
jgi:UPF0176 protein